MMVHENLDSSYIINFTIFIAILRILGVSLLHDVLINDNNFTTIMERNVLPI